MTTNVLITAAIEYLRTQTNTAFNSDLAVLERGLQTALETILPANINLTTYRPDFETVLLQLVQALQTDDAWRDVIPTATGQTLLRNMASGLSGLHLAVIRATQENFSHLAQSDNAVLANTRFLGVNPKRRTPAQLRARLVADDFSGAFTIPPLSEFVVGGVRYFNRDRVVFNDFALVQTCTLYEGTLYSADLVADGVPFESVTVGNSNGRISADDVYCTVDGAPWTRRDQPWTASETSTTFTERTDGTNVTLRFGDGVYGALLPVGAAVRVQWAETDGDRAAPVPLNTLVAAPFVSDAVTLTGVVVSALIAGGGAVPASVYRVMAPHMRAADKTAINRIGFKAVALDYPNVVDAYFQGQAELGPNVRAALNYYSVTVLTKTGVPMTTAEWDAFIAWLSSRTIENLHWRRLDPYPIRVTLSADVYCTPDADLQLCKTVLERDIATAFAPKLGALGYSVYSTDIGDLFEGSENSSDARISRLIEYATNIRFDYTTPATPYADAAVYPEGGLVGGNLIMPTPRYYAVLDRVGCTPHYTKRSLMSGRRDI